MSFCEVSVEVFWKLPTVFLYKYTTRYIWLREWLFEFKVQSINLSVFFFFSQSFMGSAVSLDGWKCCEKLRQKIVFEIESYHTSYPLLTLTELNTRSRSIYSCSPRWKSQAMTAHTLSCILNRKNECSISNYQINEVCASTFKRQKLLPKEKHILQISLMSLFTDLKFCVISAKEKNWWLREEFKDFSGDTVVKNLHLHYRGHRFQP